MSFNNFWGNTLACCGVLYETTLSTLYETLFYFQNLLKKRPVLVTTFFPRGEKFPHSMVEKYAFSFLVFPFLSVCLKKIKKLLLCVSLVVVFFSSLSLSLSFFMRNLALLFPRLEVGGPSTKYLILPWPLRRRLLSLMSFH